MFSKTKSPNPESPEAFELAFEYAKKVNADLILTTDPDADRIGIAFKNQKGEYELYTGNQTGALLINYVIGQRRELGLLKDNSVIFDTVVTSSLGKRVAKYYGVDTISVLTGFKFIGDQIHKYEMNQEKHFEFGYEESYGYLIAPFVRDKDSLQAIVMVSEMVNFFLKQGKTLDVVLDEIMKKVGYYDDHLECIYFEGANGKETMKNILDKLRKEPIKELAGIKVEKYEDYLALKAYDSNGNTLNTIDLPVTNLMKFYFEDGSTVAIRPSGTEPKCKFYFGAVSKTRKENEGKNAKMFASLKAYLNLK